MARRKVLLVDVLKEVRRSIRVLRRVERFLVQQEKHQARLAKRAAQEAADRELLRAP